MKIKISYEANEEYDALDIVGYIKGRFPDVKCRKSNRYPPFYHIYLAIKNRGNPHNKGKK